MEPWLRTIGVVALVTGLSLLRRLQVVDRKCRLGRRWQVRQQALSR